MEQHCTIPSDVMAGSSGAGHCGSNEFLDFIALDQGVFSNFWLLSLITTYLWPIECP